MTGSDTSNSPQHSEDTPRAHTWGCLRLLLCGRVVALCSTNVIVCCTCRLRSWQKTQKNSREKTASVDVKVRMGCYIKLLSQRFLCYRIDGHAQAAAALHSTAAAAPRGVKAISYSNSSHTSIELQGATAMRLDCCWAAGS